MSNYECQMINFEFHVGMNEFHYIREVQVRKRVPFDINEVHFI